MNWYSSRREILTRRSGIWGVVLVMLCWPLGCQNVRAQTHPADPEKIEKVIPSPINDLNSLLAQVASYHFGQDRLALVKLGDWIRDAAATPSLCREAEIRLLSYLKSNATLASKDFVCRQLSLVGTEASTSQLAAMLLTPETSDMARYALERIPGDSVNGALRRGLAETGGKERIGIINTLGVRRDAAAVAVLKVLLRDGDAATSGAAAAALGTIATLPALAVLSEARPRATGIQLDQILDATQTCAARLTSTGNREAAWKVYQELNRPDQPTMTRIGALRGMVSIGGEKAISQVLAALSSQDGKLQAASIRLLNSLPGENMTSIMMEQIPKLSLPAKVQMVSALADRGDRKALPVVVQACHSSEAELRQAALAGLGKLGDSSVVPLLTESLVTQEDTVREAARLSLYRLRGADVDASILQGLETAPTLVKVELIRALGERSVESATQTLFKTTKDPSPEIRRESIRALRELAGPQDVPALLEVLSSVKSDQERGEAERALTAGIRKAESPDVFPVLTGYMANDNVPFRGSLLQVLGGLGNNDGLPLLKKTLKEDNPDLKRSAILALSEWPNSAPANELLAIAREDSTPTCQILALRGYIKLVSLPEKRPEPEIIKQLNEAMGLAKRPEEKRMILAALPQFPCPEALQLAENAGSDKALSNEAKLAVTRVKEALARKQ